MEMCRPVPQHTPNWNVGSGLIVGDSGDGKLTIEAERNRYQ